VILDFGFWAREEREDFRLRVHAKVVIRREVRESERIPDFANCH
jgi:hypothetical protein